MLIEDRIARWREEENRRETETFIELLCDAEGEIRRLRVKSDAFDRAYKELHKACRRTSDTEGENPYLAFLRHGPASVSAAALTLGVTLSTASRGLSRLQNEGLVTSERAEADKRKVIYSLVENAGG